MCPLLLLLAAAPQVDLLPPDAGVRLIQVDAPKATRVSFESERSLAVLDGQAVLVENACLDLKAHQSGVVLVLPAHHAPEPSAACQGKPLASEGEYPVGGIGTAKFLGHAPFAYAGELSLTASAEVKPHQHDGSDEIVLIQAGAGTFTVGGQARKVSKGEALFIPRGTPHAFVAGPQPVKVIQFYSPAGPRSGSGLPRSDTRGLTPATGRRSIVTIKRMDFSFKRPAAAGGGRATVSAAPTTTTATTATTSGAPDPAEAERWRQAGTPAVAAMGRHPANADGEVDGYLIGAKGVALPPGTSLDSIAKVMPKEAKSEGLGIFVNGVMNTAADQAQAMESLADASGLPLVGVHNATGGLTADIAQTIKEKLGLNANEKCVSLLARVIVDRVDKQQPLTLFGHSQGALIVSDALTRAKAELVKRGTPQYEVEQKMGVIHVETFATASSIYPDGPKYVHYINTADPVPRLFGTGNKDDRPVPGWGSSIDNALSKVGIKTRLGWGAAYETRKAIQAIQHPGRGAVVIRFRDDGHETAGDQSLPAHRLATYLKHRVPFDQAGRAAQ